MIIKVNKKFLPLKSKCPNAYPVNAAIIVMPTVETTAIVTEFQT